MPQSIPKGLTRTAVLQALADLDTGIEHTFGSPTGYEVFRSALGDRDACCEFAQQTLLGSMTAKAKSPSARPPCLASSVPIPGESIDVRS